MTTIEAKNVKHNAFSTDLGSDFVAVDSTGRPVSRAATREGVERAAPNHSGIFTGKDFTKTNKPASEPEPLKNLGPAGSDPAAAATQHQPEHTFEETLLHVEKTHDPEAGRAANQQNAQITENMRKDSLEGQERKNAEQAKVEAADPNAARAQAAVDAEKEKQDPLDHDGNGRRGGSRRQRRPA